MKRNTVLVGDVREQLATLPDESVHCVVTSPPYWGLRDYGTAEWEGGDAGCDHKSHDARNDVTPEALARRAEQYSTGTGAGSKVEAVQFAQACGKCGARRIDSQLGLEATPEEYVANMVAVFRDVRRVLRRDGTLWLNLGDSYTSGGRGSYDTALVSVSSGLRNAASTVGSNRPETPDGLKPKDLVGIPWRVAFALQADGWWLRSEIIWSKPNPMPESVTDRPTKAHEYLFLLTKSERYYYDAEAIREPLVTAVHAPGNRFDPDKVKGPMDRGGASQWERDMTQTWGNPSGRNKRTVWEIATEPYSEAHFATYPQALVLPCIQAGTSEHGCCSVCGAPWRRVVEVDADYAELRKERSGYRHSDLESYGLTHGSSNPSVTKQTRTTGWEPTCKHEAPITPALVLDPFFGSGTTGLVALRAARDYIGIELNPAYAAMAERRLAPLRDQVRLL